MLTSPELYRKAQTEFFIEVESEKYVIAVSPTFL